MLPCDLQQARHASDRSKVVKSLGESKARSRAPAALFAQPDDKAQAIRIELEGTRPRSWVARGLRKPEAGA